ncbi:hypothetical protein [Saccharothrix deserti]|uniref:hypothetical protein n=1 Tax=Saccharothrix deserti TaxID=2593674 RepID=UPI00131EB6B9|nr:hypothetical protein [Saccharothrix deserti]
MTATPARAPTRHYRLLAGLYVGQWLAPSFLRSGAVLLVYDLAGWTAAVLTLAVATAVPAVQVARLREPRASDDGGQIGAQAGVAALDPGLADGSRARPAGRGGRPRQATAGFGVLVNVFRRPGVARWALVVMPLTWAGIGGYFALLGVSIALLGVGVVATALLFGSAVPSGRAAAVD